MFNDMVITTIGFVVVMLGLYYYWLNYEVRGERAVILDSVKKNWLNIAMLLGAALLIKAYIATQHTGYESDLNCFRAWGNEAFEHGFFNYYKVDSGDGYPPAYVFLLWIQSAFIHWFKIDTTAGFGLFFIKSIPILFELGAGFFIYYLAKRRFSEITSLILAATYLFNPAVITNSSIWGQVDSVFTLLVVLVCYYCMTEKRILAYFLFCLGVLLKFQMIMYAPILIFTIIEQVFMKDFSVKKMVRDLIGGVSAILVMFLSILPFDLSVVIPKYTNTLNLFKYCSVNAYNVWAILGKNWASQDDLFLFVKANTWGTIAIVSAVIVSGYVFYRMKEDKSKYFVSMAILMSIVFLFSVRMHERYLFPAMILVLIGFILRPSLEMFLSYVGFSTVIFINTFHVYYTWKELGTTGPSGYTIGFCAVLTVFFFGFLMYTICKENNVVYEAKVAQVDKKGIIRNQTRYEKPKYEWPHFHITPSDRPEKMSRADWIVLLGIMVLYSLFALPDLGYRYAPETGKIYTPAFKQFTFDFGETKDITNAYVYAGCYESRQFTIETSNDGVNYNEIGHVRVKDVFKWNDLKLFGESEETENPFAFQSRYVRFTLNHNEIEMKELLFKDSQGNLVQPVNTDEFPELFDEKAKFDPDLTFHSGTYFDEIYHARTAYEMIHGLYNYENTHPPLGKFIISLGIRIFGMNPFGWRIMGTLFGIAMIPFFFLFCKRILKETWIVGVTTFLFTFDFMHFVQTRIATIDVYGTFFIIAMYYFMYRYSKTSFYDTELKKTFIPLGLSGIMMGLGCASKWTAVYAAAGLGIFFFANMFRRYMEYRIARNTPTMSTNGISHQHIMDVFPKNLIYTLLFCVVFFVILPGTIYYLSYIPFNDATGASVWHQMIRNQQTMFNYHSKLEATHPYSSVWYEWPTTIRPVYYVCNTLSDGRKLAMSAFGNPLVWWAGIFALAYMVYRLIKKKDAISGFLIFAYMNQLLPWMLVPRCTFAYHYFPSVPFATIMIGYSMFCFTKDVKRRKILCVLYAVTAFSVFLLFFPCLSGKPVTMDYVAGGLKWLRGWTIAA